jgi:hypothetical protein
MNQIATADTGPDCRVERPAGVLSQQLNEARDYIHRLEGQSNRLEVTLNRLRQARPADVIPGNDKMAEVEPVDLESRLSWTNSKLASLVARIESQLTELEEYI